LEPAGGVQLQLLALHHAGTRDQEQRAVQPDFETAELHAMAPRRGVPDCRCRARYSQAARTKPQNSGWPSRGVDVNSGWNWQATNQGWSGCSTISTSRASMEFPATTSPAFSDYFRWCMVNRLPSS